MSQNQEIALEGLIGEFENDKVYKKIRRIAWEEVNTTLSKGKDLLKLAVSSVIESIIKDPDRYNFLVSSVYNGGQYATSHPYVNACRTIILDEAEKLFKLMVQDLTSRIINETALTIHPQTQ
jgi:hypothetical protein